MPDSLTMLQALAAMAVYALNISCLSIEHVIISEGARRAQNLASANLSGAAAQTYHRTFWVLYSLEKTCSFYFGRSSVRREPCVGNDPEADRAQGFVDCDIACPVPRVPESLFGGFDWFLTFAKQSRLLSRALTSLFSVGVAGKPRGYYAAVIDQLNADLEQWRLSIPVNWQPGENFTTHQLQEIEHRARPLALWTLFLYNGFRLSLVRARLHLTIHFNRTVTAETQTEHTKQLMETSRSILELLSFIDAEPHTPLW
jgi:hypothetical protein